MSQHIFMAVGGVTVRIGGSANDQLTVTSFLFAVGGAWLALLLCRTFSRQARSPSSSWRTSMKLTRSSPCLRADQIKWYDCSPGPLGGPSTTPASTNIGRS